MCIFTFRFFSIIVYYKICLQFPVLYSRTLSSIYFRYSSVYLLFPGWTKILRQCYSTQYTLFLYVLRLLGWCICPCFLQQPHHSCPEQAVTWPTFKVGARITPILQVGNEERSGPVLESGGARTQTWTTWGWRAFGCVVPMCGTVQWLSISPSCVSQTCLICKDHPGPFM